MIDKGRILYLHSLPARTMKEFDFTIVVSVAGKNLESMGDPIRVSGEAVGEGTTGIHPDAPVAFLSVGCVVIHGSRIAARLALLCGSRRFETQCRGRREA